jgi:exopolysaccharide biosynthesis polyprenyl glycosylphosphotransferase
LPTSSRGVRDVTLDMGGAVTESVNIQVGAVASTGVNATADLEAHSSPRASASSLAHGSRRRARAGWMTTSRILVDAVALLSANLITTVLGGYHLSIWTLALFDGFTIGLMAMQRAYRWHLRVDALDDLRSAAAATAVAAMTVITLTVLVSPPANADGVIFLWLVAATLLSAGRVGSTAVTLRRRRAGALKARALIVGAGQVGQLTAHRFLDHPEFGVDPVGFLDKAPIEIPGAPLRRPVLGASWDFEAVVQKHEIECVVFSFSSAPHDIFLDLVDRCERLGLRVLIVPRLFERVPSHLSVEHVGGLPLLEIHPTSPKNLQFTVKYAFDRVFAAILIVLLSPILLLTALAVRISLGQPILYRQARVGLDGRRFEMLKFRSMRPEVNPSETAKEFDPLRAPGGIEGADRRTRVGSFVRATSLDELAQLVNVAKGEMSLVGPRPERPEYVDYFVSRVRRYDARHRVKGGITGWAQIHRLRGKTSIADRVEWDNYYIENFSLWLDFKILLMTIPAIIGFRSE